MARRSRYRTRIAYQAGACIAVGFIVCTALVGRAQMRSEDYLTPRTLEYEMYLDSVGKYDSDAKLRNETPRRFMNEVELYSGNRETEPNIIYVRLSVVDATKDKNLLKRSLDTNIHNLNRIFGDLPENLYGVEQIAFCVEGITAGEEFRLKRTGRNRGERLNDIDFEIWTEYVARNKTIFEDVSVANSIPIVVVDGQADAIGFTSGVATSDAGGDAIVVTKEAFSLLFRKRDKSQILAHLVANHIGLPSLWAQRGSYGDHVSDTPLQLEPNFGEPAEEHTTHRSMAPGMPIELVSNVMDNTWDPATSGWTKGQTEFLVGSLRSPNLRGNVTGKSCVETSTEDQNGPPGEGPAKTDSCTIVATPNPVSSSVELKYNLEDSDREKRRIAIAASRGEIIRDWFQKAERAEVIDLQELTSGSYEVVVFDANNQNVRACSSTIVKL